MDWISRIGRRLKFRDLHILMVVAQSGTMARAAHTLAVSQPVVSKSISDIEHALGVKILDRSRHGIELNLYGQSLLKHSASVFDELRQCVEEIEFLNDPTVGELRIGCTEAMAAGLLPVIIKRLHRRHPRLTFRVTQAGSAAALYRELRDRNVDLILGRIMLPISDEALSADVLFDDPLMLIVGSRNRWARRRKIELAELMHEPWILPPVGTAAETMVEQVFRRFGLKLPQESAVCVSVPMHDSLLTDGPYIAMRPASIVWFGMKRHSVKTLPVKLPALPGPVAVVTCKGRTISPVAQLFVQCAREVVKPLARKNCNAHVA
jgi:DNA-binding transcriptional LysR family regulator